MIGDHGTARELNASTRLESLRTENLTKSPVLTINQQAFLEYLSISNILTDTALIVIPAFIVWPLKMTVYNRLRIISIFGTRSLFVTLRFGSICLGTCANPV